MGWGRLFVRAGADLDELRTNFTFLFVFGWVLCIKGKYRSEKYRKVAGPLLLELSIVRGALVGKVVERTQVQIPDQL